MTDGLPSSVDVLPRSRKLAMVGFTLPLHPLATQIGGERNRGARAISVRDPQPSPAAILSS